MKTKSNKNKNHFDVLIVVPLSVELEALLELFQFEEDLSVDDYQINRLKSPIDNVSVCLIKLKEMGNAAARAACEHFLKIYSVGIIICYGIAGGLKKDLKLGDVCVSHRILDLSDQLKIGENSDGISISPSPKYFDVDRNICSKLAFMCENPVYRRLKSDWEEDSLEVYLNLEAEISERFQSIKD